MHILQLPIDFTIMSNTGTRFRWAFCQIETLRKCTTVAAMKKTLDELPKTLVETHARILQDIWTEDAEKGRAILTWLLWSKYPLNLDEVAEATVVRPGDALPDPDDRLLDPTDVFRICRSFLTVSCGVIHFAHFSVKENLVSGRSKVFDGGPRSSHEYIADCFNATPTRWPGLP